jgi:hypothetical protein
VLLTSQAVAVGTYVEHLIPELLVVAEGFVDNLPWTTDQSRTALDGILDRVKHRLDPSAAHTR